MNLFSEIYSTYFTTAAKILRRGRLSSRELNRMVEQYAFSESMLFLTPKLTEKTGWGLLSLQDQSFVSILKQVPEMPLTLLEKRWLAAILCDKRTKLFLEESEIAQLHQRLGVKPLFDRNRFRLFDQFRGGDNVTDAAYIRNFRLLLQGIQTKEVLKISFQTRKGKRITHYFLPLRLEYSAKNDCFRVYTLQLRKGQPLSYGTVNVSRITGLERTGKQYNGPIDVDALFTAKRCMEPAVIQVSSERNGVERFLLEFASFERQAETNLETGTCLVKLWYDQNDETELLIRILSFGPIVEILSPASLREKAKDRIFRQNALLEENGNFPA